MLAASKAEGAAALAAVEGEAERGREQENVAERVRDRDAFAIGESVASCTYGAIR